MQEMMNKYLVLCQVYSGPLVVVAHCHYDIDIIGLSVIIYRLNGHPAHDFKRSLRGKACLLSFWLRPTYEVCGGR